MLLFSKVIRNGKMQPVFIVRANLYWAPFKEDLKGKMGLQQEYFLFIMGTKLAFEGKKSPDSYKDKGAFNCVFFSLKTSLSKCLTT